MRLPPPSMGPSAQPSVCAVCGGVALGYHYDAEACAACRAFFRRVVALEKTYDCKGNGDCYEKAKKSGSEFKCPSCRFERCVAAGMNPCAIQCVKNKADNTIIRKIVASRATPIKQELPATVEETIEKLVEGLLERESDFDRLRRSSFSPKPRDGYYLDKLLSSPCRLGERHQVVQACAFPCNHLPLQEMHQRSFQPLSTAVILRILGDYKWWPLADAVYTIEYIKSFPFFSQLSSNDKRILASRGVFACADVARSYFSYGHGHDFQVNPDLSRYNVSNVPGESAKEERERDVCDRLVISAFRRINAEREEYVLLKAILLCDPTLEGLSDFGRQCLEKRREAYTKSLFSYVIVNYSMRQAPTRFESLIAIISLIYKVVRRQMAATKDLYSLASREGQECVLMEEILWC